MNTANKITLFRLCLVPVFPLVFFSSWEHGEMAGLFVFFLAGASDVLDGHIARTRDMITPLGVVLDPLADKLMTLTVLGSFVYRGYLPSWILWLYLGKEGIQILIGTFFYFHRYNIKIPSNLWGKLGTTFLYALVFSVGLHFPKEISFAFLGIALCFALLAFFSYGRALIRRLRENKKETP